MRAVNPSTPLARCQLEWIGLRLAEVSERITYSDS